MTFISTVSLAALGPARGVVEDIALQGLAEK